MKRTAFSPHDEIYINYLQSADKHNMRVQHYHDMYEIYFQLGGRRYLFYDNICYTLERGDIAVILPFDIHYAESRDVEYYERYVVNFSADSFCGILNDEEKYLLTEKIRPCVMRLDQEQTQKLFDFFKNTESFYNKKGFLSGKMLRCALLQLVMYAIECADEKTIVEGKTIEPQLMAVIKYINRNYTKGMTLEELASVSCMSKYHFSRKFKETTGATVFEYLNNVRLTKVHSLLIDTDTSIEEIAQRTGFSSSAQLMRVFKGVYGVSPRTFRKNSRR